MNHFTQPAAAIRYATARPYIHPWAIAKIQRFLRLTKPLPIALDVGCGTGQSSLALTTIANEVIGVDPSHEMTLHAHADKHVHYIHASAEQLPFLDASFRLLTVAMAFHWFERKSFLAESSRVLQNGGWLIIYNGGFLGQVPQHPEITEWYWKQFMVRYPIPTDFNKQPLMEEEAQQHGFHRVHKEAYQLQLRWSPQEFAGYLSSMSHVNAAIERGEEQADTALGWLLSSLIPLYPKPTLALPFGGYIEYWQKVHQSGP